MMPGEIQPQTPAAAGGAKPVYCWYHKMGAVLFATFCLEVGFFLLIFPWTDGAGYFSNFAPGWRGLWENPFVRGGVSILGIVNVGIALFEIGRLRRFAKPQRVSVSSPGGSTPSAEPERKNPAE